MIKVIVNFKIIFVQYNLKQVSILRTVYGKNIKISKMFIILKNGISLNFKFK